MKSARLLVHALDIETSECYKMTDKEEAEHQKNIEDMETSLAKLQIYIEEMSSQGNATSE